MVPITPPNRDKKAEETGEDGFFYGESVMELRVQLKVCEGCGCLWYRAQTQGTVYCRDCEVRLKDFPSPETRKRRGRPPRKTLVRVWGMAAIGGAE
jgi:hypothetical protein